MARTRPSAAVLLTRGEGSALELFLVERSRRLRAFPGFWALPGGTVDPVDRAPDADPDAGLERCALRELFEETGVLAPPLDRALAPGARAGLRAALLAEPPAPEGWRALGPALERARAGLRPVCRLTTPPFGPVRFENVFLHLELPPGQTPEVLPGELERGRFLRPADALGLWRAGELALVPPVLFLVQALAAHPLEGAFAHADRIAREVAGGRLHPIRFAPGVQVAPLETPTLPPATTTNCLLVGEERVYVVDPATPHAAERERLYAALDELLAEGRALAGLLLTHHHADHVGAAEETARRYGLELLAHEETLRRLPFSPGPTRALADGDALPLGRAPDGSAGWSLRALHTPGHAPGHLVFVEDRYRACIAGDLVSTLSTIVIDPEDDGHLATYLASLRRVLAHGIGTVHPAHGPAVPDGSGVLRHYLAHRAAREEKLVAALAAGLDRVEPLVEAVYDDTPRELFGLAARSLRSGLAKLEEEGRAARRGAGWELTARS